MFFLSLSFKGIDKIRQDKIKDSNTKHFDFIRTQERQKKPELRQLQVL